MWFIEKYSPLILGLVILILSIWFKVNLIGISEFGSILSAVITISSIIIAFLGTMMTILITLSNEEVMLKIRRNDGHKGLIRYLKSAIISGVLLALFSLYLFVATNYGDKTSIILTGFFISICVYFLVSGYRIFSLVIMILDDVLDDKTSIPEKEKNTVKPKYNKSN